MSSRLNSPTILHSLPFWIGLILWNLLCWRLPFFWDNILNSRIAQWYLEDGFQHLIVPEAMDAGHPPFFSLYVAGLWAVFGKSLMAAHLGMLPFLIGIQLMSLRLAKHFLPEGWRKCAMLILFAEPALFAQSAQITPDIALLCFYLVAVVSVVEDRRVLLFGAMIGMGMVSFRGILGFGALASTDFVLAWMAGKRKLNWLNLWPYVAAASLAMAWLLYHKSQAGWMLSPPDSTYGAHRKMGNVNWMMRNAMIIVWRWLDHGRIFLWLWVLGGITILWTKRKITPQHKQLLAMALIPALTLALLFIPFSNPIGHRYFLPTYFMLALLGLLIAHDLWKSIPLRWIFAVSILGLMSGHAWVYPDSIAKGWDATLAHLPYHHLRSEATTFIDQNQIARHEVCTDFPMISAESFLDPSQSDTTRFAALPENLKNASYVLYSNVCNGFSDDALAELKDRSQWKILFEAGGWPVKIQLLEQMSP